MKHLTLVVTAATFLVSAALAAPPVKKPGAKAAAKPPAKTAAAAPDAGRSGLFWDAWYTITVNKTIHYSYYNEKLGLKDGKILYQSKSWKQEEGYINEEQIGAMSSNAPDLIPMFFNFHSTYRSTETSIDGNVKDGKFLTVKVRKGNTDLPLIKKTIPSNTIFSVFFPIWLRSKLASLKPNQTTGFNTILEDNIEANFGTIPGVVRLELPDQTALRLKTEKLSVNYKDLRTTWYVEKTGKPLMIEIPAQKTLIELVPMETAQSFLDD
ncbi:MAG: hypothetical protein A2583_00460 [Bdellovibrionales bacterium RIFOXYD1_FULL_53_11]|nr:MAG: hypothetical protein A2583_00460 [Bdellovibrionales bacterium RIFOXYD1_FULL_53_11]